MSTHSIDRSASVKHVCREATQLRPLRSRDTRSHREAFVVNDVWSPAPKTMVVGPGDSSSVASRLFQFSQVIPKSCSLSGAAQSATVRMPPLAVFSLQLARQRGAPRTEAALSRLTERCGLIPLGRRAVFAPELLNFLMNASSSLICWRSAAPGRSSADPRLGPTGPQTACGGL